MDFSQFTQNGKFLMLALDQRESFRKILNTQNPDSVDEEEMIKAKSEIIDALYDQFSGILIDPKFGLPAYKSRTKPFLLPVEKSGHREIAGERVTEVEYEVSQLKDLGASGIKIVLQFNPYAKSAQDQLGVARKVAKDCRDHNLPFFLEIVTYFDLSINRSKSELVIESTKTFLRESIIPDVFKLEYPGDSQSCEEVTKLLNGIPWILLTAGVEFEMFKKNLLDAMLHGASGFLAGRSIWQEIGRYQNDAERKQFLTSIAAKRFEEISDIVMKNSHLA